MSKKRNLLGILAASAILAGCNSTQKKVTIEQYGTRETYKDRLDSGKEIKESWNEGWKRQNLHEAADALNKYWN